MAYAQARAEYDPKCAAAFRNFSIALPALTLATNIAASFLVLSRVLCVTTLRAYIMRPWLIDMCQHVAFDDEKGRASRQVLFDFGPRWSTVPSSTEDPH